MSSTSSSTVVNSWSLPTAKREVGAEVIASRLSAHAKNLARVQPTLHTHHPPPDYPHLTSRRKKALAEFHRTAEIEHENLLLVSRFRNIIGRKQIDNIPPVTAIPRSLNRGLRAAEMTQILLENARMMKRIGATRGVVKSRPASFKEAAARGSLERTGEQNQEIIKRHCTQPFQDPLTYKDEYYVDQENPFKNYLGGKTKLVAASTTKVEAEKSESQSRRPSSSYSRTSLSSTSRTRSARPQSAALIKPTDLIAQDPVLLLRKKEVGSGIVPKFLPLKIEQNPIALAQYVAKLEAKHQRQQDQSTMKATRPQTARPSSSTLQKQHQPLSPTPAIISGSTSSPSAAFPASPGGGGRIPLLPTSTSLQLFDGQQYISGRHSQVRLFELNHPWRIEIEVLDMATEMEYNVTLEFTQLKPFFTAYPELFSPADKLKTGLVQILRDSLCFISTSSTPGIDSSDESTLELCCDLVQPPPPLVRVQAPRPGSAQRRHEEMKREREQAKLQQLYSPRSDSRGPGAVTPVTRSGSVTPRNSSLRMTVPNLLPGAAGGVAPSTSTSPSPSPSNQPHLTHLPPRPNRRSFTTLPLTGRALDDPSVNPSPPPSDTLTTPPPPSSISAASPSSPFSPTRLLTLPISQATPPSSEPTFIIPSGRSRFSLQFTPAAAVAVTAAPAHQD